MSEEIKQELIHLLVESLAYCALISDLWSSDKTSFLGIAISFITAEWKLWTNGIAVSEVFKGFESFYVGPYHVETYIIGRN